VKIPFQSAPPMLMLRITPRPELIRRGARLLHFTL
jgi:hypothetical protein